MTQAAVKPLSSEDAWSLFKRGDAAGAAAQFERLLGERSDDAQLHLRYGRVLAARHAPQAEGHLRRALELQPAAPEVLTALGVFFTGERRFDEAAAALEAALEVAPADLPALIALAELRARQKRHAEAYALYGRAIRVAPKDASVLTKFSRALNAHALRLAERAAELDRASSAADAARAATLKAAGRLSDAEAVLQKRIDAGGDPALGHELAVVRGLQARGGAGQPRPAVWPRRTSDFADLEKVIRDAVLRGVRPGRPILSPRSKVVTLGSCFAEHLAASLKQAGVDVFFQKRSETLDNLYATAAFLDALAAGASEGDAAMDLLLAGCLESFRSAEVVILSLGVAAAYFDRATGAFVPVGGGRDKAMLAAACEFRMLSVEENLERLRHVLARIRAFSPDCRIVLTISPIPLSATYDRPSAVQADAVSKSTMRLTVEALLNEAPPGVHYWPSFEIVRWLGPHLPAGSPQVFGADDGASRHVSGWLVRLIIRLFLQEFGEGFGQG